MSIRNKRHQVKLCRQLGMACVVLLLAAGCLSAPQIERIQYYTVTPKITVEKAKATDYTLGIRPLFSSRTYGPSMAYLDNDHQLGYQPRNEWAESPSVVVTRAINDALAATERFSDVGNAADMVRPDLILTGELRVYQEDRTLTPPQAELEVRLELRQTMMPGALYAETIKESEPLQDNTPAAFASAMNIAVSRFAERVAANLIGINLPEKKSDTLTDASGL